MRNKATLLCLIMVMIILSSCSNGETPQQEGISEQQNDTRANILNVSTNLTKESNWWVVPKGATTMTINVEAENTDIVLFWISPTGTETGKERTLIGYDVDGSDGWSYTWDFGDMTFHDHIQVHALGIDGYTQASDTINVHSP